MKSQSMENNGTYYVELIARYLAGEAEGDDLVFLSEWLKADPEHRRIFEEYRRTWMSAEQVRLESAIDLDREWEEMEKKLAPGLPATEEGEEVKVIRFGYTRVLRIAALFILLAVPAWFLYRYFAKPEQKIFHANSTIAENTLPDGSVVTLNTGSVIEYPARFTGKHRNVRLTGEAFFEVRHEPSRPFIVSGDRYNVEVIGTSFYVNTLFGSGTMEVIVKTGRVAVFNPETPDRKVMLSPGEQAEITLATGEIVTSRIPNENYLAWKTGKLVFTATPLYRIVEMLNKAYHADIRITDSRIADCLVTASFDNQPLESVLKVLQATLHIRISEENGIIGISGDGCR
jgi:transmembrane sensor